MVRVCSIYLSSFLESFNFLIFWGFQIGVIWYDGYWIKVNEEAVLAMAAKEGKEVLTKNSDQAVAEGAFGLPWFVATNSKGKTESFWGVDHLGQVVAHLGIEKPRMEGGWKASL